MKKYLNSAWYLLCRFDFFDSGLNLIINNGTAYKNQSIQKQKQQR